MKRTKLVFETKCDICTTNVGYTLVHKRPEGLFQRAPIDLCDTCQLLVAKYLQGIHSRWRLFPA